MDLVPRRQENMRRPITTLISGKPVEMVTIGYVARVFGRSTATIKYWERVGLFPPAPFRFRPNAPSVNRRLYPSDFVKTLHRLDFGYLGTRLDYRDFPRFHEEVRQALQDCLASLRAPEGC
jgi:hypothetical protein